MNIALVLSGGTGSRLGLDIPKQYIKVNNKMIISYCLETLMISEYIDAIQIVSAPQYVGDIEKEIDDIRQKSGKPVRYSTSGETRQLSIFNGLKDIEKYAKDQDLVMIHDGARPLLSEELIKNCFDSVEGHDGVLPILPMKDTVYISEGGRITSLLKREKVVAGQAPEVFRLSKYIKANEKLQPDEIYKINGSTEPAILAGMDIVTLPGDERNFKITTKADLQRFIELMTK